MWDLYILLVSAAAVVPTVLEPVFPLGRRLGAAGSVVGLVLWYLLFGPMLSNLPVVAVTAGLAAGSLALNQSRLPSAPS